MITTRHPIFKPVLIAFTLLLFLSTGFAQKSKRGYKLQQPRREHKSRKIGFVGDNPRILRNKIVYMKPKPGRHQRKARIYPDSKIKKPKRHIKFLAAEKSSQSKHIRIPKKVTDKQMVLPKMRGDKKRNKKTKIQYVGFDPGMSANRVKEKKNSDIQYRSYYKFNGKGGLDKGGRRKAVSPPIN